MDRIDGRTSFWYRRKPYQYQFLWNRHSAYNKLLAQDNELVRSC